MKKVTVKKKASYVLPLICSLIILFGGIYAGLVNFENFNKLTKEYAVFYTAVSVTLILLGLFSLSLFLDELRNTS